jgi:hypothetical protein
MNVFGIIKKLFKYLLENNMADQRIQYTENMVGANHPTLGDTLNRLSQVQHANDGTHANVTLDANTSFTTANGTAPFKVTSQTPVANLAVGQTGSLTMQGEANATSASSPVTLNLGSVTAGDRILVMGSVDAVLSAGAAIGCQIYKSSGTATMIFMNNYTTISNVYTYNTNTGNQQGNPSVTGIIQVTGSGTLIIQNVLFGGWNSINSVQIYAFFLKKQ